MPAQVQRDSMLLSLLFAETGTEIQWNLQSHSDSVKPMGRAWHSGFNSCFWCNIGPEFKSQNFGKLWDFSQWGKNV